MATRRSAFDALDGARARGGRGGRGHGPEPDRPVPRALRLRRARRSRSPATGAPDGPRRRASTRPRARLGLDRARGRVLGALRGARAAPALRPAVRATCTTTSPASSPSPRLVARLLAGDGRRAAPTCSRASTRDAPLRAPRRAAPARRRRRRRRWPSAARKVAEPARGVPARRRPRRTPPTTGGCARVDVPPACDPGARRRVERAARPCSRAEPPAARRRGPDAPRCSPPRSGGRCCSSPRPTPATRELLRERRARRRARGRAARASTASSRSSPASARARAARARAPRRARRCCCARIARRRVALGRSAGAASSRCRCRRSPSGAPRGRRSRGTDDVDDVAAKFRLSIGQIARGRARSPRLAASRARTRRPAAGRPRPRRAPAPRARRARRARGAARRRLRLGRPRAARRASSRCCSSISAYLRHRDLRAVRVGLRAHRRRATRALKVLFAGESGTGKTMAAQVLARDLGLDLFRIDLATVVSKYIGETEKNLDRIFAAAEGSNAILFFDEADALFGKRSEVQRRARPLREHRGRLPAAADGGLPGRRHPGDELPPEHRRRVPAPARLRRSTSRSRSRRTASASGASLLPDAAPLADDIDVALPRRAVQALRRRHPQRLARPRRSWPPRTAARSRCATSCAASRSSTGSSAG